MREKIEENGRGAVSLTGEIVLAGSLEQSRPFVKASAGNYYYICRKSGNLYSPGENNGLLFSTRPVLREYLWNRHDVYFRSRYLLGDWTSDGTVGRRGCSVVTIPTTTLPDALVLFSPWRLDVAAPVFRHRPFYGTTLDASSVSTNVPYRSATSTRI